MTPAKSYSGPLPPAVWEVLTRAHTQGIAIQSNHARFYAVELALLASIGWVSTVSPDGRAYSTRWLITPAGITALTNKEHMST